MFQWIIINNTNDFQTKILVSIYFCFNIHSCILYLKLFTIIPIKFLTKRNLINKTLHIFTFKYYKDYISFFYKLHIYVYS